ncbi:tetratricopeptide repeat protein [Anabaenopsis tanganyikae CS-531]|uniref:Tetratricopeptide repeat protein n=2 Tax=Anabaenopsis TaxID=110103 RepID=A0ABT6K9D8_9CYAN|nr:MULTISPECIES: tetratricopeptide repeat protein [Anabaenopsis]MDB9541258.1 tetratricopeptide repeat protein [Anabaenopsis arnoldii]MDH6093698.1 tetratricopeptide repeat protein [Anabaenopsis arnoldii]MDH6104403.1 tetratricopeptide repeat protein [Anabaenopsis tanganyikae CS-531]
MEKIPTPLGLTPEPGGKYQRIITWKSDSLPPTVQISHSDTVTYIARSNVYRKQQKWDLALADYNKAIAIDPNDAYAYLYRGAVYVYLRDINKARENLQRAGQLYLTQDDPDGYQRTITLLNSL